MKLPKCYVFLIIGFFLGTFLSGLVLLTIKRQNEKIIQNDASISLTQTISPTMVLSNTTVGVSSKNKGIELNINIATANELENLPGIGPEKASAIIEFRTRYGFFVNTDELLYVPGIGNNLYDSIKELITVGSE